MAGEGEVGVLALDTKSVQPYATQDEYLYAMKEDLAEWFNTLYGLSIAVNDFFEQIETGVTICQHANNVQSFIKAQLEAATAGAAPAKRPPCVAVLERGVQYRSNVKAGSFQARDNVSNFIAWCKALGINNVILFETEDLVLRKNERHVVLCLLEVARRGAQYGMLAPTLVQMEREIDAEMAGTQPPEPVPHVQRKTCDLMSLDEMVREMVSLCTCPDQFHMAKVSDGKYKIGDSQTLIFVRILRNHVMVRIGGGWDTLQNYLDRHDPCRCAAREHKGRVAGMTPHKAHTRRQSAPSTQILDGQRMRTATPSADSTRNQRAGTPSKAGATGTRSKRSQSVVPAASGEEISWKTSKVAGGVPSRGLDPATLPSVRSPSPASSETSQASQPSRSSGVASISRDSGIGGRREVDSASDAGSSCGGSPGLHKRFNSATDLSFPKELTLSSVTEDSLPRMRPTSARDRVRRAAASSGSSSANQTNNNNNTSRRGRQKQKTNMAATPARQTRSRSVEPMELNNERFARQPNNVNKTDTRGQRKQDAKEVLIISRDSAGKHRLGPQPVSTMPNGDSSDLDGYRSGGSRRSSTSSSMSGPSNSYSNGYTTSSEDKSPGTPRVNISPDRVILPDRPKLMSRSHTADLSHVGESSLVAGDDSTDTETETRTRTVTRMSVSSNQSSTLSLASSFDDYPDAPPEDRNLNAEMERLFEEYRRQEIKAQKKSGASHKRHRRSNSADLLEMDDSSFQERPRINNAFQKARSSSRDMLDSTGSGGRVSSRRSTNVSVEKSSSATCSASSTPRRVGPITPKPTRSSSLRGALGMARELRNKLSEQSISGRQTPVRSSSMNTHHRPTTPLASSTCSNVSSNSRSVSASRSQTQTREADDYRAGSHTGSRAGSRASSRSGSCNQSRDSSLTQLRPSSAMNHREQQEKMTSGGRWTSTGANLNPALSGPPHSKSTNSLYPEANVPAHKAPLSTDQQLTCQTGLLLDKDHEAHTPKPRKDKRQGRTRIPMPVDMLANGKYDNGVQPLRKYDSGVDINNMSPTESSVHGDDNWQQELLLQPEQNAQSLDYNVTSGNGSGRPNGQSSTYDDMF